MDDNRPPQGSQDRPEVPPGKPPKSRLTGSPTWGAPRNCPNLESHGRIAQVPHRGAPKVHPRVPFLLFQTGDFVESVDCDCWRTLTYVPCILPRGPLANPSSSQRARPQPTKRSSKESSTRIQGILQNIKRDPSGGDPLRVWDRPASPHGEVKKHPGVPPGSPYPLGCSPGLLNKP